eukprot:tig00022075_g23578.t1
MDYDDLDDDIDRRPYDDMPSGGGRSYHIPELVKDFISFFHRKFMDRNTAEILELTTGSFERLSERYYKNIVWPPAESVGFLCDNDPIFLMLYRELYFRHIYARLTPTIQHRFESWENYCQLMQFFLNSNGLEFDLPAQWIWDMIDEYIYQFQSFCQYRANPKHKTEEEIELLKQNPQVWSVHEVLQNLHDLVKKSNIRETLHKDDLSEEGSGHIYRLLGYFAMIGQLRVHCLLGDYHLALKSVASLDLSNKNATLFTSVTACQVTTYYYVGFAYLMMRRYVDCIKSIQHVLLYITRAKAAHAKSGYQSEQIMKKTDQMYGMVALALALAPQRIDENIQQVVREKYAEKLQRLQRGEEDAFRELFAFCCPKFISPVGPNYEEPAGSSKGDAYVLQLRMFLAEVRQQSMLPTIRSYLRLYTTIPVPKLVDFLGQSESDFRTQMMCLKHKTRQLVWKGGAALQGAWSSASDVDFFIDVDMVHVADVKKQRSFVDYFVRHINKFDEISASLLDAPRV